jgi:hypothetical protein
MENIFQLLRSAFHFDGAFWIFFEALREARDFTFYCGRQYDNPLPVLAVGLAAEYPSPQGLLADERLISGSTLFRTRIGSIIGVNIMSRDSEGRQWL